MFRLFKKKKEPVYTTEIISGKESDNGFSIDEVKCFKDGDYTHSVKILCFPESIIEKINKIQGKL